MLRPFPYRQRTQRCGRSPSCKSALRQPDVRYLKRDRLFEPDGAGQEAHPGDPHPWSIFLDRRAGKPGPDKWCADEAAVLIDMLHTLKSSGVDADLYVVTPFVIVQDNLRQDILRSRVLDGWVDNPNAWVWEHVGTVHTVQGREAGIVFFVLGAQMSSQNGARAWAGGRPNLVNVAVTRAKASLYVIGNRQLWKSAGVFAVLDRYLPDRRNLGTPE